MVLIILVLLAPLLSAQPAILLGGELWSSTGPDGTATASPTTIGVALLLSVRMRIARATS